MGGNPSSYKGCLLGLAVGDAMGYTVNDKTWAEIQEDYGPNGLLGYDLVNGCAEVTAYTHLAAYICNGLLVGITRGRTESASEYLRLGLREWMRSQWFHRDPEQSQCWVAQKANMRRGVCRDIRMLDNLRQDIIGSLAQPCKPNLTPSTLTSAVAAGMFFDERWMTPKGVGRLGAEAVAMTHGSPEAFLSGALIAYMTAGILQDKETTLKDQFLYAVSAVVEQFQNDYPNVTYLADNVCRAISMAREGIDPREGMEVLRCHTAPECVAGAVFACLSSPEDFDTAIITAVNHSGQSAAVGALTGALLGAKLGEEALPEFYLESLNQRETLQTLAEDMAKGSVVRGLFDDDWDQKYTHGKPI
ncbi:MAG: ADP-ribosylglycohydrolase family protein [Ruminococcaceae bacterium]|nr:ADP-ribosylglycohydrolase family protein [Oscillospiraceae bacterium]